MWIQSPLEHCHSPSRQPISREIEGYQVKTMKCGWNLKSVDLLNSTRDSTLIGELKIAHEKSGNV